MSAWLGLQLGASVDVRDGQPDLDDTRDTDASVRVPIPRSEAVEQGAVDLSVPVLRESSHQYISMRVEDSTNTGVGFVPPCEIVTGR